MGSEISEGRKVAKTYVSSMENPLGFQKHHWNILWLSMTHLLALYGYWIVVTGRVSWTILFWLYPYGVFMGLGTTVGCHRLWTHKTFKAKLPLQVILAYMQTASGQYPIFNWCKDHRLHHKFVETDADPHDARRGFWFSHIGWLLAKEHPAVKEKEATIDFSDLDNDPVIRYQRKYYWYFFVVAMYIAPMSLLHILKPELPVLYILGLNKACYITTLHITWLVNSAAHIWGFKPYDKSYLAADNWVVSLLAIGEGWHNYHHTFPWDYKAAELGLYRFNWSTMFIDFFAWVGWAYDLKTVPEKVVRDRVNRTGDGSQSHSYSRDHSGPAKRAEGGTKEETDGASLPPWGWGDEDISEEHYEVTLRLQKLKAG